ncbi:MAG: PfkB family carbohydrate kinase [Sphaerochaetaceae bacterium]
MEYDIIMIGHVSQDVLIDYLSHRQDIVGGAVVYSSFAAAAAGKRVKVITKLSDKDRPLLDALSNPRIHWSVLHSEASTSIKNTYFTADKEQREVILLSQADPFSLDEIDGTAEVYHLAGLFVGELPDTLIKPLATRGAVALDAQGVLRTLDATGNLAFRDWDQKRELLPFITYFKTDAAEARILTGVEDRREAVMLLHSWGAKEVMLTHNSEVMVYAEGKIHTAPYTNSNTNGRTGRGDTTFAAYLAWRADHSAEEATKFAAALCSMKMETPGVFGGTQEDVLQRMKKDN